MAEEPPAQRSEPGALARYLGPGRMPSVMIQYPRVVGLVLLALGGWLIYDLWHVSEYGGFYRRSQPLLGSMVAGLGGFLVAFGRPKDDEGYAPDWWNQSYIAVVIGAAVIGLAITQLWL